MAVTGARRFCPTCSEHVHDLSAMSLRDAQALLQKREPLCVRYLAERDGTLRFPRLRPACQPHAQARALRPRRLGPRRLHSAR